jgi:alpha-glucosidase
MAEWLDGAVIYQIYPRSFADSNGDGIGDLTGIRARLDYLARLGVDALWLSPFFRSPMKDFGYDVSCYTDVDPIFGTLADFDDLLTEAHARGLKVIIDQVLSHTSIEHPWFQESRQDRHNRRADWYVWADPKPDGTPPTNWLAHFGGAAWTWEPRRGQYYLHNFLAEQPDLNFTNPEVVEAILGEVEFWLQRGVDGVRLDTVNMYMHDLELRDNPPRPAAGNHATLTKNFNLQIPTYSISRPENLQVIEQLRRLLDRYGAIGMGELGSCGDRELEMARDYTAPGRLHTAYTFLFLEDRHGAAWIREVVSTATQCMGSGWPTWSFSNHDVERVVSRWGGGGPASEAMARAYLALLVTLRGTAIVYQGEELGLPQAEVPFARLQDPDGIHHWPVHKGRDGCRTPMPWTSRAPHGGFTSGEPWLPVFADHLTRSVEAQKAQPGSVLCSFRRFLAWRRTQPALRTRAEITFLPGSDDVVAFVRTPADHPALLIAINLANTPQQVAVQLPGRLRPVDHGLDHGADARASVDGTTLHLAPFAVFIGEVQASR